jgi:hypothetical protein
MQQIEQGVSILLAQLSQSNWKYVDVYALLTKIFSK